MNIKDIIAKMENEKLVKAFEDYTVSSTLEKDIDKKNYLNGIANLMKQELIKRLGGDN